MQRKSAHLGLKVAVVAKRLVIDRERAAETRAIVFENSLSSGHIDTLRITGNLSDPVGQASEITTYDVCVLRLITVEGFGGRLL